jgi:hypothetical protein
MVHATKGTSAVLTFLFSLVLTVLGRCGCSCRQIGSFGKPGRHWISRWTLDWIRDWTIGEFCLILLLVGMLVTRLSIYVVNFESWSAFRISNLRAPFFRSLGELNFATLAYVMLPLAQNSLWVHVLGISFDRAVLFLFIHSILLCATCSHSTE